MTARRYINGVVRYNVDEGDLPLIISDYQQAIDTNDKNMQGRLSKYLSYLIKEDTVFTPENYRQLVIPLFRLRNETMNRHVVLTPVIDALTSPVCPPDVLSAACRCQNTVYRKTAAKHPSCPEEDAVLVVLQRGSLTISMEDI